ncbi:MAG: hypothetical protein QXW70_03940 [Candidatus Anstonellales archaeon]
MRLITHTDFDGVICAVLITCVEVVDEILFLDPATIQEKKIRVTENDIIADLPFHPKCGLWFDHHATSKPPEGTEIRGSFSLKKSAARVVYEYYENPYLERYQEVVDWADRIDSGEITPQEAINPSGWRLLSETLESDAEKKVDDEYRWHVIEWIRKGESIEKILERREVKKRTEAALKDLKDFLEMVKKIGRMEGSVSIVDMRGLEKVPKGNNFLIYVAFPSSLVSVRIYDNRTNKDVIDINVGRNTFNRASKIDIGALMKEYGGGGHPMCGGTHLKKEDADKKIKEILERLQE